MKKMLLCLTAMSLAMLCACTAPDSDKTSSDPGDFISEGSVAQTETSIDENFLYPEKTLPESGSVSDPNGTPSESESSRVPTDPQEPSAQSPMGTTVPAESTGKQESITQIPSVQPAEKQTEPNETTVPIEEPTEAVIAPDKNEPVQTQPETATNPEPEAPEFDIQLWIDYAISYGQQIGLEYDSSATECWDNPIIASSQSKYLERDITSRLNRYQDRGMTGFCVWAMTRTDGKFDLYIGYR